MKKLLVVSVLWVSCISTDTIDDLAIALSDLVPLNTNDIDKKIESILKMPNAGDLAKDYYDGTAKDFYEKNLKKVIKDGLTNKTLNVNMALPVLSGPDIFTAEKGTRVYNTLSLLALALANDSYDTVKNLLDAGADHKKNIQFKRDLVDTKGNIINEQIEAPIASYFPGDANFITLATDNGIDLSQRAITKGKTSDGREYMEGYSMWLDKIRWGESDITIAKLVLENYSKTHGNKKVPKNLVISSHEEKDAHGKVIKSKMITIGDRIADISNNAVKTELEKWIE